MYELLREGSAVSITLKGRPDGDDLAGLNTYLEEVLDRHGCVRILVELGTLSEDDVHTFVDGLERHLDRSADVDRVAVVGDEAWEARLPTVAAVFPEADVQTYTPSHLAEAWAWVRGKR